MSKGVARIGLRSAIIVLSVVLTVLVMAAAILPSASVAGPLDNHVMQVRGYVYDDHGNKIANADVVVTMYNGGTPGVSKAKTSSASPLGYFSVDFAVGEWFSGNTIWVVSQYQGGTQGVSNSVTADGNYMFQWENTTIPYEIPQFGSMAGLLLTAGLVGGVAAVAVVWRRSAK